MASIRIGRWIFLFFALPIYVTGCVSAQFSQPVASFRDSVSSSASVISSYYTNLNSFERKVYLESVLTNPKARVLAVDANGKPTPLRGALFDGRSIKARLDAINLLGAYGQRLADLAGSKAPSQFSSAATALGTNLTSLTGTFQSISSAHTANPQTTTDATAASYIGPISSLIGTLGQMYIEQDQAKALGIAITDGTPKVNQILDLLETELKTIIEPAQITGLLQELSDKVLDYNQRVDAANIPPPANPNDPKAVPFSEEERSAALTDISGALSRLDVALV